MKQIKDTEYLHISARIRCLEQQMLDRAALLRIAEAATDDDAVKMLADRGWKEFSARDLSGLEQSISQRREEIVNFLGNYCPDRAIIEIFCLQYDYHNIKAIIKGRAQNIDCTGILSGAGLIEPKNLQRMMRDEDYAELNPIMAKAITEAEELLSRTRDPQLSDILLDRAQWEQITELSEQTASEFLHKYIKLSIDCNNIKTVARLARMGRGLDYLVRAICPGGNLEAEKYFESGAQEHLTSLFEQTPLEFAAETAIKAMKKESTFAALDMACDNALICCLREAKTVPFGEATVIAYFLANEAEFVGIRTVFYGRDAGLTAEQIAERLRVAYV